MMNKPSETAAVKPDWLPRLNLILTMVLAGLGFWLNYTAQQHKQALETQKSTLDKLGSQLAEKKDFREERGSREQLRIQLFDKVAGAIEKKEDRHVEAARALVQSLLSTNDPTEALLRVGLIQALSLGAPVGKQQEFKKVAEEETTFQSDQRELAAEVQEQSAIQASKGNQPSSAGNALTAFRVDVFYCGGPASSANLGKAQRMQQTLKAQVSGIRVRVRELAPSINASPGFGVTRIEVRYEVSSEASVAADLAKILSLDGSPLPLRPVNNSTPWYLSVFAC